MNRTQIAKTNMYRVFLIFGNAIPTAIIALMPNFAVWYADWKDIMTELFNVINRQAEKIKGRTDTKAAIADNLAKLAINLASKMKSYATRIDDLTLYNKVDFQLSTLLKLTDTEFIANCQNILAQAVLHQIALVEYGIIEATITEYTTALDSFIAAAPETKAAINERKVATADIKRLIKESGTMLKNLDGAVRSILLTHRAFNETYFAARKVASLPKRKLVARGLVTDSTGAPLPLVTMTCEALNINRKVSAKGAFLLHEADNGEYIFKFFRTGYQTVTQTIGIYNGVRTEVLVIMPLHGALPLKKV